MRGGEASRGHVVVSRRALVRRGLVGCRTADGRQLGRIGVWFYRNLVWGLDQTCCCEFFCCGGLTVCALEVPAVARTNGPIDVFEDLHRIGHNSGTETEVAHVSFVVSNIDILHVDEHFSLDWSVRGGGRMRGIFCVRII